MDEIHRRCGSHNHTYKHDQLHPILQQAHESHLKIDLLTIEIVFHVLSPLPGFENATEDEIINHLDGLVQSVNADFSAKASNFDSALVHHPLFQDSKVIQWYHRKKVPLPGRISQLYIPPHESIPLDDPVLVYQNYLKLAIDTRIQFVHSGSRDQIKVSNRIHEQLSQLDINDPEFGSKLNQIVKTNNGSSGFLDALNIWIIDLPHGLLGYSTFPWDRVSREFDGVCISSQVAGKHFEKRNGINYQHYNMYHTFTHEIAHNLGLLHTFNQDLAIDPVTQMQHMAHDGDFCIDTPCQKRATQGSPYLTKKWMCDEHEVSKPYQFTNFMDYSNDECMFMFTPEQRDRMRKVVLTYRQAWLRHPHRLEFISLNDLLKLNQARIAYPNLEPLPTQLSLWSRLKSFWQ